MTNNYYNISKTIKYKSAQTLYYAIGELSETINQPFNYFITINFKNITDDGYIVPILFAKFRRDKLSKWYYRTFSTKTQKAPPLTYAYCFENALNKQPIYSLGHDHNIHLHFLIHLPDLHLLELDDIEEIFEKICSSHSVPAGTIHIEKIWNGSLKNIRKYLLKGVDPSCQYFCNDNQPQGDIAGKRAGTSRNLGPKNRRKIDKLNNITRPTPQLLNYFNQNNSKYKKTG
ncbi:hypothetical protein [Entomobacter blattae]|nr:hypothetical protein [Entomobacter blattae]